MLKMTEMSNPDSCLNRALPTEMVFVLLARDAAAPLTIRFWCVLRWLRRKNRWSDPQIQDALKCARVMQAQRRLKQALGHFNVEPPEAVTTIRIDNETFTARCLKALTEAVRESRELR